MTRTPEEPLIELPFRYQGVITRILPLQADLGSLREFCAHYLNVAPNIAYFEPYVPYVQLIILTYERMTSDASPDSAIFGQNEILFNLPLRWHDRVAGVTRSATVNPYIFVDNDISATTGRELYGWPKERAWLSKLVPTWSESPSRASTVAQVDVRRFDDGEPYDAPLLRITHASMDPWFDRARWSPPNPRYSWLPPWMNLAEWPSTALSYAQHAAWGLAGAYNSLLMAASTAGRGASQSLFEAFTTIHAINLKQIAAAEEPNRASYQALTATPLDYERLSRGGPLGAPQQLMMDLSGGYEVCICRDTMRPIVQKLGLHTVRTLTFEKRSSETVVDVLKPVAPFWVELDIVQQKSRTLGWRSANGEYSATDVRSSRIVRRANWFGGTASGVNRPTFNDYLGELSSLAPGGLVSFERVAATFVRFQIDDWTEEPYWLTKLNALIAESDDSGGAHPPPGFFERVRDDNVQMAILVIYEIEGMSARYKLGEFWDAHAVEFCIPLRLKWTHPVGGSSEEKALLYSVASFSGNSVFVRSMRELYGGNWRYAGIEAGGAEITASGLGPTLSGLDVPFRVVTALTVHELNAGERTGSRPVLQLLPRSQADRGEASSNNLLSGTGLSMVRIKELPRADDPSRPSYRAVVVTTLHPIGDESPPATLPSKNVTVRLYQHELPDIPTALNLDGRPRSPSDRPRPVRDIAATYSHYAGPMNLHAEVLAESAGK